MLGKPLIKPNFATVGSESVLANTRGMIRPQPNGSPCSEYRLGEWWVPVGLSEADLQRLDALVFSHRWLKQAQALYRSGDPCGSVYLVRSGSSRRWCCIRGAASRFPAFIWQTRCWSRRHGFGQACERCERINRQRHLRGAIRAAGDCLPRSENSTAVPVPGVVSGDRA